LFEFDAMLIPVQLFAQFADFVDQVALAGFGFGEGLAVLKNHFGKAA
jgi:hypothetical protein